MEDTTTILNVDHDSKQVLTTERLLKNEFDCKIDTISDPKQCVKKLRQKNYDIVLIGNSLDIEDSQKLLSRITQKYCKTKVIVILHENQTAFALEMLKAGAFDAICQTIDYDVKLKSVFKKAIDYLQLENHLIHSEKLCAIGKLLTTVVHELNNPLSGIIGFSKLLISEVSKDKYKRDLLTIHREAMRCHKIVKNILSFASKNMHDKNEIDLHSIIEKSLDLQTFLFRKENIQIIRKYDKKIPKVFVNPQKMQQVFLNLLTNAYQSTLLTFESRRITVETITNSRYIKVKIIDTGMGIPEKCLSRLFTPFFTTKKEGTGLGLSICKDIIEEHHGKIYGGNNADTGATFTVEIPVEKVGIDPITIVSKKAANFEMLIEKKNQRKVKSTHPL